MCIRDRLFDGRRAHWVEDFTGERFSLVFFTCPCYERASEVERVFLRNGGFGDTASVDVLALESLLSDPRVGHGYLPLDAAHGVALSAAARDFWGAALKGRPAWDEAAAPGGPEPDADVLLQRRARAAYEAVGLERAVHKAFEQVPRFRAWGADVDGLLGEVSAPLEGRQQLFRIVSSLCAVRRATKRVLQRVLGLFAVAFGFQRPLLALLHHCYVYTDKLLEDVEVRVHMSVLEELKAAALHLVFAKTDLRRALSSELWATDATPRVEGRVTSRCLRASRTACSAVRSCGASMCA